MYNAKLLYYIDEKRFGAVEIRDKCEPGVCGYCDSGIEGERHTDCLYKCTINFQFITVPGEVPELKSGDKYKVDLWYDGDGYMVGKMIPIKGE